MNGGTGFTARIAITWPPGCPPNDSIDGDGVFYRVTRTDPPTEADFLTHQETGQRKKLDECERCCLSLCQERADAVQTSRLFPKLGNHIAQGKLDGSCGKVKLTGGNVAP